MRFYTTTHQYYCGIDLHARVMYLCIINSEGEIVLHRNMKADPESLLKAIKPYRPDILIGVECIFTWYWMSDLCAEATLQETKRSRSDSMRKRTAFRSWSCPVHESHSWRKGQE